MLLLFQLPSALMPCIEILLLKCLEMTLYFILGVDRKANEWNLLPFSL